ncbi:malate synthase A [Micrococcales bacterium 31B]|nr:malate synthase A [Micrococcales bacterium 31B]
MNDIVVTGAPVERGDEILTPEALSFLAALHRNFAGRRNELLQRRAERRAEIAQTGTLDFLPETAEIRAGDWKVAPAPADLLDRRVEMTGPTDRKMTINALNSGAKVWLADLEDANTPHWANVIGGQVNLFDANRRTIEFTQASNGKHYTIADPNQVPVILPRPRGWHLDEAHILVDGERTVGALVDFGLYFFHNAKYLIEKGSGPYFYLPKMESHLEARLWNDVFTFAQKALGVPHGSVRGTVLIETITAAFEMDEILYELREHISGLNAGRWDYLFSVIKNLRDAGEKYVLPDRSAVTMRAHAMAAYSSLLVQTCHKRGAFAMGGMAAFIPSRKDPEINAAAFSKITDDKQREADLGFDGSWVAHPDLVPVAQQVFDSAFGDQPNQLTHPGPAETITAADLLAFDKTPGEITLDGVRESCRVAVLYVEAWLGGLGAVGINNLMEDAATAEISRSQLWQWIYNGSHLASGEQVTRDFVSTVLDAEFEAIRTEVGEERFAEGHFDQARAILEQMALTDEYADFLTLPAYEQVLENEKAAAALEGAVAP